MQHIDFAQEDEIDRSPHIAYVERLIVAVKYQYLLVHTLSHQSKKSPLRLIVPSGLIKQFPDSDSIETSTRIPSGEPGYMPTTPALAKHSIGDCLIASGYCPSPGVI